MSTETNDPLAVAEAMMKERRDTVKSLAKLGDEKATLQEKITQIEQQESRCLRAGISIWLVAVGVEEDGIHS
jgi:primosomal protein N''